MGESEELLTHVTEMLKRMHGESDYRRLRYMLDLVLLYKDTGRKEAAVDLMRTVVRLSEETIGPDHSLTHGRISVLNNILQS